MIKTIATCDRCGKEWQLYTEESPYPERRPISGSGEKELCPECATEFDAIIDTVTRLKNLLIEELTSEWFFNKKMPFKITALVSSMDNSITALVSSMDNSQIKAEYSEIVRASKVKIDRKRYVKNNHSV